MRKDMVEQLKHIVWVEQQMDTRCIPGRKEYNALRQQFLTGGQRPVSAPQKAVDALQNRGDAVFVDVHKPSGRVKLTMMGGETVTKVQECTDELMHCLENEVNDQQGLRNDVEKLIHKKIKQEHQDDSNILANIEKMILALTKDKFSC